MLLDVPAANSRSFASLFLCLRSDPAASKDKEITPELRSVVEVIALTGQVWCVMWRSPSFRQSSQPGPVKSDVFLHAFGYGIFFFRYRFMNSWSSSLRLVLLSFRCRHDWLQVRQLISCLLSQVCYWAVPPLSHAPSASGNMRDMRDMMTHARRFAQSRRLCFLPRASHSLPCYKTCTKDGDWIFGLLSCF